eukprot:1739505-Ditylum_brightwellii.AAC.1
MSLGMTCRADGWWGTLMAFHPLGVRMNIGGMWGEIIPHVDIEYGGVAYFFAYCLAPSDMNTSVLCGQSLVVSCVAGTCLPVFEAPLEVVQLACISFVVHDALVAPFEVVPLLEFLACRLDVMLVVGAMVS